MNKFSQAVSVSALMAWAGFASAAPLLASLDMGDVEADIGTAALAIIGVMVIVLGARLVIGFLRR